MLEDLPIVLFVPGAQIVRMLGLIVLIVSLGRDAWGAARYE
jgi:hypothetical protein